MSSNTNQRIIVVGPSGAGKSTLLAALSIAADQSMAEDNGEYPCKLHPANSSMRELAEKGRMLFRDGRFATTIKGTERIIDYSFRLEVDRNGNRFWPKALSFGGVSSALFDVPDAPGGSIFTKDDVDLVRGTIDAKSLNDFRNNLIAKAKNCNGLMLCIDADDTGAVKTLFEKLRTFIDLMEPPLPFERIAIALTKAEIHFHDKCTEAERCARKEDPRLRVKELLTKFGVGALLAAKGPKTTIACGWSSVYGFIAGTGEANYDKVENRLRTFRENENPVDFFKEWQPFRLMDPFIFLLTGDTSNMEILKRV